MHECAGGGDGGGTAITSVRARRSRLRASGARPLAVFLFGLLVAAPIAALEVAPFEGSARGFPVLRVKEWSEQIDVEPGRTFAGFGFTLAAKALRSRLVRGERVELHAVGFTPKPRAVTVELSYGGRERMRMADRVLGAERFDVHPKLPWIADLFMNVPDAHIWLSPPPAVFLRFEGPMAEPADPITRVDLLPGGSSGPATPVATGGRK